MHKNYLSISSQCLLVVFVLHFLQTFIFAADFTIPFFLEDIALDGELNDAVWHKVPFRSNFKILGSEQSASAQTRFKLFHNRDKLFIGIECDEPYIDKLVDKPDYSHGSALIWLHDSVEVNFVPEKNLQNLFKYLINCRGVSCALWGEDDNTGRAHYVFNKPYSNLLQSAVKQYDDKWTLEIVIPIGTMNTMPDNNDEWRFNIGRNRYTSKPAELSASSNLVKTRSHLQVPEFQKVKLEGFSANIYQWELNNLNATLQRTKDGDINCLVSLDIVNNTEEFRICKAKISLIDMDNLQTIQSEEWKFDVTAGNFNSQKHIFKLKKQGKFYLDFELYSNLDQLLKKIREPIELNYQPLTVKVLKPAYRNNIYASMKDKSIELQIKLEEYLGSTLEVKIEGENFFEQAEIKDAKAENILTFDASTWNDGTYKISITGGTVQAPLKNELMIKKLPYQKGEVWLNSEGIIHYDGEPRLPIGWYLQAPINPLYDTAVNMTHYKDFESFKNYVKKQEDEGRIAIYTPYQEFHPINYNNWKWTIFRDPDDRRSSVTEEQKEKIKSFFPQASKLSGIMGWYLADEPEGRDHNPNWYIEMVELMKELDPYHPTFMLNYGIEGMKKFSVGCDILMPDCYPQYFEDGSTGKPRWSTSQWMQALNELGKPGWLMVQISPWPDFSHDGKLKGIPPSFDDIRSQFYQALLHNAKGITMYAYYDSSRFETPRRGTDAVAKEIRVLESLMLQNSSFDQISWESKPEDRFFQVGMKKYNELIGIIAVNTSREKRQLSFKLAKNIGNKLFVAGEKRSITIRDNQFTDIFAAGETHVYLNDERLASEVESLQEIKNSITAAIVARKKPGNLIATGELYAGDYKNLGKGLIPDNYVKLSASSERLTYSTRDTKTLYYLLDGLTDPTQPFYSWTPRREDNVPWLDLKLPEEVKAKKIVLYSGYDQKDKTPLLQGATVLLLTEEGTYKKLASSTLVQDFCMELSFPATNAKNLRLRIDKWRSELNGYLLTEVELY